MDRFISLILITLILFSGCSDEAGVGDGAVSRSDPAAQGAYLAEPGVKNVILIPGATTSSVLTPLTIRPLKKMKKHLEAAGFKNVEIATYDNVLSVPRVQMEQSLLASLRKIMQPGETYHIIGHSMGHYVAMVALIEGGLTGQVGKFIGLAGAASGGSGAPIGCGSGLFGIGGEGNIKKCPAMAGMFIGRDDYMIDRFKAEHADGLAQLDKCSVAVENDRFLQPADSGFFEDGVNSWVSFARHDNLPGHKETVPYLRAHCGL